MIKKYTIVARVSPGLTFDNEKAAIEEAKRRANNNKNVCFTVVAAIVTLESDKYGIVTVKR